MAAGGEIIDAVAVGVEDVERIVRMEAQVGEAHRHDLARRV